jgi:hypothetical protein
MGNMAHSQASRVRDELVSNATWVMRQHHATDGDVVNAGVVKSSVD